MKTETLDLHGSSRTEALEKLSRSLSWCVHNGVGVLVINHGRGLHSERGLSVIKLEVRKALKEDPVLAGLIKENGYRIIYGESDFPAALAYNDGQTLVVLKGLEKQAQGSSRQQEKNQRIYSEEGKQKRRHDKKQRQEKETRRR